MSEQLRQAQSALLRHVYPNITKGQAKRMLKEMETRGIDIVNHNAIKALTNILGSVVRHQNTDYDQIIKQVGKDRARYYVKPIIDAVFN